MTRKSLRLRLFAASALSIAAVLAVSGFGMEMLFQRHVERRAAAELDTYIHQLAASTAIDEAGALSLARPLADPRFDRPFGGLYWQIADKDGGLVIRSRSLWDHVLQLPADELQPGTAHGHAMPGPQGEDLMVREQVVTYSSPAGRRAVRIAVALDRREIAAARAGFAEDMLPALVLLALVLITAAWIQVSVGLRPLEAVRRGVNAIRAHRQARLDDGFPDEVMPLVTEVNDLLEAQEDAIERARMRAGDLAHGLKTPLTVLAADAAKLRGRGEAEIAGEIEDLAGAMRRHIDRELARTRIAREAGREGLRAGLASVLGKLAGALRRTPRGEALQWTLEIPPDLEAAIDPADLTEAAGNLVDNAMKWTNSAIRITARRDGAMMVLSIVDDGVGVPGEFLAALGRRGARLDEQAPGAGLGLAIAREILEAYGGSLELANDPAGGLKATARIPAAR